MTQQQKKQFARTLCKICHPLFFPLCGTVCGLTIFFGQLHPMPPFMYEIPLIMLIITVLMPISMTILYRRAYADVYPEKEIKRMTDIPHIIVLFCLFFGYILQKIIFLPHIISCMTATSIIILLLHIIAQQWCNFSLHSSAWGAVVGVLIGYSLLFIYDPVWWICLTVALWGIIGSCQIFLHRHTLSEVILGFLTGFSVALIAVLVS